MITPSEAGDVIFYKGIDLKYFITKLNEIVGYYYELRSFTNFENIKKLEEVSNQLDNQLSEDIKDENTK